MTLIYEHTNNNWEPLGNKKGWYMHAYIHWRFGMYTWDTLNSTKSLFMTYAIYEPVNYVLILIGIVEKREGVSGLVVLDVDGILDR